MQCVLFLACVSMGQTADYTAAAEKAAKARVPLVVFVETPPKKVAGAVSVLQPGPFDGVDAGVIVAVPNNRDWLTWAATLPASATAADIRQAAGLADVRKMPAAVSAKLFELWPREVERPKGLKAYNRAQYTQRIAITNGAFSNSLYHLSQDDVWQNSPPSINPNRHFPWAVPGGLHESTDWESILGVAMPSAPRVWSERVPVPNSQPLPKQRWAFAEGTVFADMLVNTRTGKVFELRTRTKKDGEWVSKVAYADKASRPLHFTGARQACIECHQHAGSSLQYGITLRGDDGAFSWSPLEKMDLAE